MNTLPPEIVVSSSSTDSVAGTNPAFLTCDDAAAWMHESLKGRRGTEFTGYILKNQEGRFFCAQEVRDADESADTPQNPDFPLAVSVNLIGEMGVPSGYTLEAGFSSREDIKGGLGESAAELALRKHFFSVSDLSATMSPHRHFSIGYLSLSDNALISYTSDKSAFEQELYRQLARKPEGKLSLFESLYERGVIPSSILVLLTLAAGTVATLVPGSLWRRRGTLKASWRSDILVQNSPVERMPVCGPILKNAVEVAEYLHTQFFNRSAEQQVGIVLKHKTQDIFVVTAPVTIPYASFSRASIFPPDLHGNPALPEEFRVHGFYHTVSSIPDDRLPSREVERYRNFFSIEDLRIGLSRVTVAPHHRLFLCTPDGAVLRFAKPQTDKVLQLASKLNPQSDDYQDIEQKILSNEISPQSLVDLVADAGVFGVLHTSKSWPQAGRITVAGAKVATGEED